MCDRLSYLYNNLYNLDENEKKYLLVVINEIINKDSTSTEKEKKLLIKYSIMYKCLYYNYPIVDVEFIDERNISENKKNAGGWYDANKGVIYITSNTLNDAFSKNMKYPFYSGFTNDLERMLQISFHECEHYFQNYDFKNNNLNLRTYYWTVYQISKLNNPQEYSKNYSYKQIENQANIRGWHDTGMFLAQHRYNKNVDIIPYLKSTARHELSHQKETKSDLIEYYNISILVSQCYQHPSLVDQNPILKEFFIAEGNNKGTLKDCSLLIAEYNKLPRHHIKTEEIQIIYREFFNYIFNKNINSIDKNSGLIVLDLITADLISLQGIFDYEDSKSVEKRKVVRKKIDRILKYFDAIEYLNLLNNYDDPFGSIKDIIYERIKETLKVYETSKEMYRNLDKDIELDINKLREKFNCYDIEKRYLDGRKSAINI